MVATESAREEILSKVRSALRRSPDSTAAPIPAAARYEPRLPGDAESELARFLAEVEKLGVKTRRLGGTAALPAALAELVRAESVKQATLWQTVELQEWGIEDALRSLGVGIVSPYASNREVAQCDLGITGADYALPETGTLVLRSSVEKPRTVSLLAPVHLAIIRPAILRADLHQVFEAIKRDPYFVFITGRSRTSDIELTVTYGLHGPKEVYIWVMP